MCFASICSKLNICDSLQKQSSPSMRFVYQGWQKTQSRLWCINTDIDPTGALLGARRPSQTKPYPTVHQRINLVSQPRESRCVRVHVCVHTYERGWKRKRKPLWKEWERWRRKWLGGNSRDRKGGKTKARTRRWHCAACIDVATLTRVGTTRKKGWAWVGDIVREMGVYRGVNFGAKMCSGENVICLFRCCFCGDGSWRSTRR